MKKENETENRQKLYLTPEAEALMKHYRRQLTVILVTAVVAIALVVGATTAWFANNKKVVSNGMTIQVDNNSNLIISKEDSTTADPDYPAATTLDFTVSFTDAAEYLFPSTHDTDYTTYTTGLKYVTNQGDVDISTGLPISDVVDGVSTPRTLNYADAANGDKTKNERQYYKDYTVYIAANGVAFSNQDMTAKVTPSAASQDYINAASIDFYVNSVASDNFMGTLHANSGESTVTLLTNGEIPIADGTVSGCIPVIMRCYFDGALTNEAETLAYVHSAGLTIADFNLTVTFDAADHTA